MDANAESTERTRVRGRSRLASLLALCLCAAVVVGQPSAGAGAGVGGDGRIIAHDLADIDWAWDIEFKFDAGSGLHNRPEYGLMRTYSKDFPEQTIRYTTIKCEVVGDVSFADGIANFGGGHLKCPMPSLKEAFAGTDAAISQPELVAVGARFESADSDTAPILHHPDLKFSVLGDSDDTQVELWARGSSTARSPKYSTGGGWQTAVSTIETSNGGDFFSTHQVFGQSASTHSSNSAPTMRQTDETVFYVGYTTHGGATFEGKLDHLFVDPGKFRW